MGRAPDVRCALRSSEARARGAWGAGALVLALLTPAAVLADPSSPLDSWRLHEAECRSSPSIFRCARAAQLLGQLQAEDARGYRTALAELSSEGLSHGDVAARVCELPIKLDLSSRNPAAYEAEKPIVASWCARAAREYAQSDGEPDRARRYAQAACELVQEHCRLVDQLQEPPSTPRRRQHGGARGARTADGAPQEGEPQQWKLRRDVYLGANLGGSGALGATGQLTGGPLLGVDLQLAFDPLFVRAGLSGDPLAGLLTVRAALGGHLGRHVLLAGVAADGTFSAFAPSLAYEMLLVNGTGRGIQGQVALGVEVLPWFGTARGLAVGAYLRGALGF